MKIFLPKNLPKKIKVVFIFLVLIATIFSFSNFHSLETKALTRTQYNKEKQQLEEEINNLNNEIKSTKDDLYNSSKKGATLEEELARIDQEIKENEEVIAKTDQVIEDLELQIAKNEEDIKNLRKELSRVLKKLLKERQTSPLESLLSSKNIGDTLSSLYNLNSIQGEARDLKDDIKIKNDEISQRKEEQENFKAKQQEVELALRLQKQSSKDILRITQGQESEYQEYLKKIEREKAEYQEKLKEIEANKPAPTPTPSNPTPTPTPTPVTPPAPVTGGFTVPARGIFYCAYGGPCANGYGYPGHTGVDISNRSGGNIYASASGTVSSVGWYSFYGYHVAIIHNINGTTYKTLYAHLSSFNVSIGQTVSQGQVIGSMGSTGNSTGTHLHFEIRNANDATYNPCSFISCPGLGGGM
jgi:murein DD-endopeptidase MepM/ murein hydrolase activator NlpD